VSRAYHVMEPPDLFAFCLDSLLRREISSSIKSMGMNAININSPVPQLKKGMESSNAESRASPIR